VSNEFKQFGKDQTDIYDKFDSAWKEAWKNNRVLIIHISINNPLRAHNFSREIYKSSIAPPFSQPPSISTSLAYHYFEDIYRL